MDLELVGQAGGNRDQEELPEIGEPQDSGGGQKVGQENEGGEPGREPGAQAQRGLSAVRAQGGAWTLGQIGIAAESVALDPGDRDDVVHQVPDLRIVWLLAGHEPVAQVLVLLV